MRSSVYFASSATGNIERLSHLADGGAYPAVRPDVVLATGFTGTPPAIIERFSGMTRSILAKVAHNGRKSRILAAVRDALLPKLIAGEIRIKDGERMVGGVT